MLGKILCSSFQSKNKYKNEFNFTKNNISNENFNNISESKINNNKIGKSDIFVKSIEQIKQVYNDDVIKIKNELEKKQNCLKISLKKLKYTSINNSTYKQQENNSSAENSQGTINSKFFFNYGCLPKIRNKKKL